MTRAWLSQLGGCHGGIVATKTALAMPQRETFLILFELPKAVCGTGDHHACAEDWAQIAKAPVETITKLARRQGLLLAPSTVRNSYINTVADTLTLVAELDGASAIKAITRSGQHGLCAKLQADKSRGVPVVQPQPVITLPTLVTLAKRIPESLGVLWTKAGLFLRVRPEGIGHARMLLQPSNALWKEPKLARIVGACRFEVGGLNPALTAYQAAELLYKAQNWATLPDKCGAGRWTVHADDPPSEETFQIGDAVVQICLLPKPVLHTSADWTILLNQSILTGEEEELMEVETGKEGDTKSPARPCQRPWQLGRMLPSLMRVLGQSYDLPLLVPCLPRKQVRQHLLPCQEKLLLCMRWRPTGSLRLHSSCRP